MRSINFEVTADDLPLLEKLRRRHREILLATGTYRELAETLKIPIGTVRSRLNRARAALMKLRDQAKEAVQPEKRTGS
jgi:DNA-directed RNA polymerase specialized sigma24 family protein